MKLIRSILLVFPLLSFALTPAASQGIFPEDEHPLLELLAILPDTAAVRGDIVYYTDWRAAELIQPDVPAPTSYAQWDGFVLPYSRLASMPSFQYLGEYERMPQVVGFDFFDIDRTVAAGAPPGQIFIYAGELDVDTIANTLTSREPDSGPGTAYEVVSMNGTDYLCWVEGCDLGLQQDLSGRDPANIFDPAALGRNPPLVLTENAIVFSFALDELMQASAAMNGDTPSLADADDYRALAEAVTGMDTPEKFGELVQAQFLPTEDVRLVLDFNNPTSALDLLGPRTTPARAEAAINEMLRSGEFADYGLLPAYQLAMFADFQGEGTQTAAVALAYDNEGDAVNAAAELTSRWETFSDVITQQGANTPLIEESAGVMNEPMVTEASNGMWIAVASANYPSPDLDASPPGQPGRIYRMLVNAISRRSFYPLWEVRLPE